ncbi:MAG: hypothetical protein KDA24_24650 [Deltaproteobacteria bacterium]|nr:hypothetical protein [Deltaproteobacteria bacterium]
MTTAQCPLPTPAATDVIGLLPIMVGTETGVRVMQRIVAPLVGGLPTSTLASLLVLPTLWFLWRRRQLRC